MAIYDGKSGITIEESLNAILKAADTDCTAVDSQGYSTVTHCVNVGAPGITFGSSNRVDLELEDSDDNITFTDVTANTSVVGGTVDSSSIWQVIDADGDCNAVYAIGYTGGKRYSRVVLNFHGTHGTGTIFGVTVIQGRPLAGPTTSQANK